MRLELNLPPIDVDLLLRTLRSASEVALDSKEANVRARGTEVRDLVDRIEQAVVEAEIVKG